MPKKKSINIANDEEFQKLPQEMRSQTMYKLHEMWLESSMHGGYIDGLAALRDKGEDLIRHCVLLIRMDEPGFPPEMKESGTKAEYHRELFNLDDPPAWMVAIEPVKKRIDETVGRNPECTWYLPPEKPGAESKKELRLADLWGITCAEKRAVLHAIDIDTMLMHVTERANMQPAPPK